MSTTMTELSNSVTARADETPASNRNDITRKRLARAARLYNPSDSNESGGKPMKANLKVALVSLALVKAKPALRDVEPFKMVLSGDRETMAKPSQDAIPARARE